MALKKYRFSGFNEINEEASEFFFGRSSELSKLYDYAHSDSSFMLTGNACSGKSSLIKAGFVPLLNKSGIFRSAYAFLGQADEKPETAINNSIKIPEQDTGFIEKLLIEDHSLWKQLILYRQKTGSSRKKVLILDSVDDLLAEDKFKRQQIWSELSDLTSGRIPRKVKANLDAELEEQPDLLTEEAKEMLKQPVNLSVCFICNAENEELITNELQAFFPGLENRKVLLSNFKKEQAADIIKGISEFEPKTGGNNSFDSASFSVDDALLNDYLSLAADKNDMIKPANLQFIGRYIEELATAKQTKKVTGKSFRPKWKNLRKFARNHIGESCPDISVEDTFYKINRAFEAKNHPTGTKISLSAAKEGYNISEKELSCSKGLIIRDYNPNGTYYYKLQSEFAAELLKRPREAGIRKKNKAKKSNKKTFLKTKSGIALSILSALLLIAFGIIYYSVFETKKALRDSKSNLYAAYAFQYMENDPTLSFRLAEKAYKLNPNNLTAHSAMLNAFYKSEAFYSVVSEIDSSCMNSYLSPDGKINVSVNRIALPFSSETDEKKDIEYEYELIASRVNDNALIAKHKQKTLINCVRISEDGQYILFGDAKGFIRIMNAGGEISHQFKAHEGIVWSIALIPDKNQLVSSGRDGRILISDFEGKIITELPKQTESVYGLDVSPDGKYIVFSKSDFISEKSSLQIYQLNGELVKELNFPILPYFVPLAVHIDFAPDSSRFLVVLNDMQGAKNPIIRVYNTKGKELHALRGHKDWINTASFCGTENKIISASRDKTARLWNLDNNDVFLLKGHTANVFDAKFSKNNPNKIISVSEDKTVRTWQFGRLLNPVGDIKNIKMATFTDDGFGIIAAADSVVYWFDKVGDKKADYRGKSETVQALDVSPDKNYVAIAYKNQEIRLFTQEGKLKKTLFKDSSETFSLKFFPNKNNFVSGGEDKKLSFHTLTKKSNYRSKKVKSSINSIDISADGKYILTAHASGNAVLRTAEGAEIRKFKGHRGSVNTAVFSPGGKYIATTGKDGTARLWSIDGKQLQVFADYVNPVNSAEFSPDGKLLLIAADNGFVSMYLMNGNEFARFKQIGDVMQAVFSPDGKNILILTKRDNVRVAELQAVSPAKILELTNEDKIFGDFYKLDNNFTQGINK